MRLSSVLILLCLVLVHSASATIYAAHVSGRDMVPGIVRPSDNIVVNSSSTLPTSVDLAGNGSYVQMNCGTANPVNCVYTRQMSNLTGKVKAWVQESGSGEIKMAEATVDELAPTISSAGASSTVREAIIDYSVADRASVAFPGVCAGIKKVEMILNGRSVNFTSHAMSTCSATGQLKGTLPGFSGEANVTITVTDYTDKTASMNLGNVYLDSRPTSFSGKLDLYRAGTDIKITRLSPNSSKDILADIVASVQYSSPLPLEKLEADFSQLGAGTAEASCAGTNTTYNCTFTNINVRPKGPVPKVNLTATDNRGNKYSFVATITAAMVPSAGTVTRIGPAAERCIGHICYIKPGPNLIVAQISTQSSFNESDVTIMGSKAQCYLATGWVCNATVNLNGDTIRLQGFDDLGNAISANTRMSVSLDSTVPARVGNFSTTPECPSSTESLKISMNMTDNSPSLTIFALTSSISKNNLTQAKCIKNGNTHSCTLVVNNLIEQPVNTRLNVMVEDMAGNTHAASVPVSVCVRSDEIPNHILEIKTIGNVPRIDKKVASRIEIKAPVSLQIVARDNSTKILDVSRPICQGISGSPYLINERSLTPILIAPLRYSQGWEDEDNLTIICRLDFEIKRQNTIYTRPETENFTVSFTLYNQLLGSINDTFTEKVSGIKESLRDLDKRIARLQKVHTYLGGFCKLAETLGKINQILQTMKSVVWGISVALNTFFGAGEALWNTVGPMFNSFQVFVDSNIWPQGWVPTGGISSSGLVTPGNKLGLVIKGTCSVYTCKHYDFNTFVDIGIEVYGERLRQSNRLSEVPGSRREFSDAVSITYEDASGTRITRYSYADGSTMTHFEVLVHGGQSTRDVAFDNNGNFWFLSSSDQKWVPLPSSTPSYQLLKAATGITPPGSQSVQNTQAAPSASPNLPAAPSKSTVSKQSPPQTQQTAANTMSSRIAQAKNRLLGRLNRNGGPSVSSDTSNLNSDTRLQTAVNAFLGENENWIYNPYKSSHYDGLCIPARLFNAEKERQLQCKRLGCIEQMAKTGGPLEACEFDYNLGSCLYVDSARYKLEGGFGFTGLMNGIKQSFMSNILGTGIVTTYLFVYPKCYDYQSNDYLKINSQCSGTIQGHRCVACGIMGPLLSGRELLSMLTNKYNPLASVQTPTKLPDGSDDYCAGVRYNE